MFGFTLTIAQSTAIGILTFVAFYSASSWSVRSSAIYGTLVAVAAQLLFNPWGW